jgi:hypothetical protein
MDDRIFSSGTIGLGVESDFYRVKQINREEIDFIETNIIDGSNEGAQKIHNSFLSYYKIVSALYGKATLTDDLLDLYGSNVLENFHSHIESEFMPLLAKLQCHDTSFYSSREGCINFFNYISHQYMRTKGIRAKTVASLKTASGFDCSNVWPLISHMLSVNIGGALFVERHRRSLTIIDNRTSISFITGDQPVINLAAKPDQKVETVSLFYPISPSTAVLISEVDCAPLYDTASLDEGRVNELNKLIYENSYTQVYADTPGALEIFKQR